MYKLWLDDQSNDVRKPPNEFVPVLSTNEAKQIIIAHGLPEFVSFDYDLGENDNAMNLLKWLEKSYFDNICDYKPFEYEVHSENPVGTQNIIAFMESWKKIFESSLK